MSNISTQATSPALVELIDGQPTTTSLDVAAHFHKRHERVLDKIRNLDCSTKFTEHNFVLSEYTDPTGRKLTQYRMTRDGFTFLCMGFTGKEAAKWKEAYINAFNQMEAALQQGSPAKAKRTPKALPNGLSTDQQEAIKGLVKARVEALPQDKRAKAAITCWSSLKSKFGSSYKAISPKHFTEAISLVARLELEGELLLKSEQPAVAATLLPEHQTKEIVERLDRLSTLFNPMSQPYADANGIRRALIGRHPITGLTDATFAQVIEPYSVFPIPR